MSPIDNSLSVLDNFFIGEFFPIAQEAYKTLKTAVLAQQTTNNARDEILLCAAHYPCQFQDDIRCTGTYSCSYQRKTSPVA